MSIAMRPTLPSLKTERLPSLTPLASDSARSLPPLSSLLSNNTSTTTAQEQDSSFNDSRFSHADTSAMTARSPLSLPTSPIKSFSTDLLTHKITTDTKTLPPPPVFKTPIRLPSFDSLQFETAHQQPTPRHSKSLSTAVPTFTTSTPAPKPVVSLPTPSVTQKAQESPLVEKRSFAFISHSPSTFPLQEPSIDNAQLARRKRRRTSPGELAILQAEFAKGQTPDKPRREEIAKKVNMTEKAVQIWFQNRRQTLRRQSNAEKEVHHLEPVYPVPQHSPFTSGPVFAPASAAPIVTLIPQQAPLQPPQITTQQPSSPAHMTSSSSPQRNTNMLITPSRPPRVKQQSPTGTTMTFRLSNDSPKGNNVMTPLQQTNRTRQKPTMKVKSQPASSPVGKENVSPCSSPILSSPNIKMEPASSSPNIKVEASSTPNIKAEASSSPNIKRESSSPVKRQPLRELNVNAMLNK